jgi:hypothetical protein
MFNLDNDGIILDITGDGGDSANREGLYALFAKTGDQTKVIAKLLCPGYLAVRHPNQVPWNNPWNFTRDQLIPYAAGCSKLGLISITRKLFISHACRLFFCQNFQRDYPGSWKYPWPHTFINDKGQKETRKFDFADILMPNDIWHLILCARLYPLYVFAPLGWLFLALAIFIHCKFDTSNDEGQLMAQATIAGKPFVKLYKLLRPYYQACLYEYWVTRRSMPDMYSIIVDNF